VRLLDRFRGRQAPTLSRGERFSSETGDALYVHLATDGGIFVIRGDTGEQLWTDRDGLSRELKRLKARGGLLLYSREAAGADPPAHVTETFRLIVDLEPPAIQLVEEPHPEALVPPAERRTITRG
jgi:hypothetical protein